MSAVESFAGHVADGVEVTFWLPAPAWFALLERTGVDGQQYDRLRELVAAEIGGGATA